MSFQRESGTEDAALPLSLRRGRDSAVSDREQRAGIAVDAGQTAIKMRIVRHGAAPHEVRMPGVRSDRLVLPQVAEAIAQAAASASVQPHAVAVGASALTSAEEDAADLARLLPFEAAVRLTHDSVTSFLGALGHRPGAVIAAGTGVVTLAVGPRGLARVDGWGYIMGDAGSGYWIGREALDAVMRAYDGRGPGTSLAEKVREWWPDLEQAYVQLQADPDRVRVVASLARAVADASETDEVAAAISQRAGRELAHSAAVALGRVGAEAPIVATTGGVFSSSRIVDAFGDALRSALPDARMVRSQGDGLDGAALLLDLDPAHPLTPLISRSDPV